MPMAFSIMAICQTDIKKGCPYADPYPGEGISVLGGEYYLYFNLWGITVLSTHYCLYRISPLFHCDTFVSISRKVDAFDQPSALH